MKLIKLSALLVLAVAMTVAATGCKRKPTPLTPLPGRTRETVPDPNLAQDKTRPTFDPNDPNAKGQDVIPQNQPWTLDQVNQDPTRFASFTVHFAFDSSAVKSGEQSKIAAVASAMQSEASLFLLIEGHCDERGTEEYNRSLGERRALALREELVKAGVNPDRIRTLSYGEDKPAVSGHDESAWSQNRRGVFVACTKK